MNTRRAHFRNRGFTLIELLVLVALLAVVFALLLPSGPGKTTSRSARCLMHLKQIDVAFMQFAADHRDKYPMQVPRENGGAQDLLPGGHVYPQFQTIAKYLQESNLCKLVICPADVSRQTAAGLKTLADTNLSYFLNADAQLTNTLVCTILAGDRDLTINAAAPSAGLSTYTNGASVDWARLLHHAGGVLAFADGHTEFVSTGAVYSAFARQPLATSRLLIP